ncbi:MSHA biogenesis protein MshL [hydrothermal vent metagenome]|uniref:MSHA biogenesis protein MshL n=1 Tax=hydrothermal vent metagenome TaxID=652676 RepID=A0A1W1C477_9ZZZZ
MKQTIGFLILSLFLLVGCGSSTNKVIDNNQTEILNGNNSTDNNSSNGNNSTDNNSSNENNSTDNNNSNENNLTDNNSLNENNLTDNNSSNENNLTDNNSSNGNNSTDNNSSNGNNSTYNNSSSDNNSTLTGKVIDGEISGATLFLDLNRDNELDLNEPSTITNSDGSYILILTKENRKHKNYLNKTAPLIVYGGKDIRTQEVFEDYLMAIREDNNLTYITPFSTLIAQTLFDELEDKNSNKLQKASGGELSSLEEKIALIKKNLAELFGIKESLLNKNPVELAKAGDNSLLSKSLQLHKTAKFMKRAMKKEVKKLKKSILKSYRSLSRELKKLKRKALKNKDEVLIEALDNSMNDSKLFDANLVKDVKKETKEIINNINTFWQGQKGTLTDNELSDAIKEGEDRLNSDTTKPIITLIGESTITLIQGTTYTDAGARALDDKDGDISSNIQVDNPVDTNHVDTYNITYNVSDSSGNSANEVTRTVIVKAKPIIETPDTIPPTKPTLTTTPTTTTNDTQSVEVNGEVGATVWVNDVEVGTIGDNGKVTIDLNTSGADGEKRFSIVLKDARGNASEALVLTITKTTAIVVDNTPPTTPTLTGTISHFTNQDSVAIIVNGEKDSILFINGVSLGTLGSTGTLNTFLNTSGDDGEKDFNLTLKDSSSNESSILNIKIKKDTIAPAQNSTINSLTTDDTTPALSGNLPSGENDTNTTNYSVKVKIDSDTYDAVNNKNGTWSIENDTISALEMGFHDVNITVTDEANNSSSTFLAGKIEIDNTGFLIDSALEGIKYVSGAYSGYTDKDGLFKYDKGAGVTFYLGDESTGISLGTAIEKIDPYNNQRRIITLFDLAGTQDENNTRVINMAKLLQSLDSDNDVSNGITIDDRTRESIALLGLKNRIDFNMDVEDFHVHNDIYELFNDLAGHFGEHRGLLDTEDVKAHLVAVRDNKLATKSYKIEKVSGEKEAIKVLDGVFKSVGGVVEGLEYRSGNQFGRTDANGAFKYEEGKKVKFYIYQLELGVTDAKAVITPADLVPASSFNHPKPRNIIRLLNAFDTPNSPNKIVIDEAVREALEKYRSQIDINLPDGKANSDLGIPQGVDEFGAQFEDFEMGKDILDEIERIRGES